MPLSIDETGDLSRLIVVGLGLSAVLLGWGTAAADDGVPSAVGDPQPTTTEKVVITSLLAETSLQADDWVFVAKEKDAPLAATWTIAPADDDPVLICTGAPYGYLRTKQQFDDFEMELEWRFPVDPDGNSGILLYTSEEDKIWPEAIQVQLHQPLAGSIFPSGDAKADNEIRDVRDVARPVNHWNSCRISSTGGTISVEMNGKNIGEVTGCRPHKGWIGLQSEGSEVHFRRIRIRELPPMAAPEAPLNGAAGRVDPEPAAVCDLRVCRCDRDPCVTLQARRAAYRDQRLKATSYVVYRDALAADGHSQHRSDCVRLDVAPTSAVVVDRGSHRVRRAQRRHVRF